MSDCALIEQWESIGKKQRELADNEKDWQLRACLIAASNAWMTCADDLRKQQGETK